jgi:probable HAF family extracellular repeat protein
LNGNPCNPWSSENPNFPRKLAPVFLQYISERPEMTPSKREIKEGQNKKRKFKIMNKPKIIRLTFALASLVAVTIAFGQRPQLAVDGPQAPPQLRYNVIDLGDLLALGIDESGHIVGQTHFGADLHAVYWPNSQSPGVDLGNLPGFERSFATDLNPGGEIVGNVATGSFLFRPVHWASSQSAPVELPGVPEGFLGEAFGINPVGHIVGFFVPADFSSQQAVFWPNSNTAPINLLPVSIDLPHSLAFSINASGNILGAVADADFVEGHAAFWASSTSTPMALASPGGQFIYTYLNLIGRTPHGLNNAGSMVGYAFNADGSETRAVFWASSTSPAVILSTSGEFMNGDAQAISDNGRIVGAAYNSDFSDFHAFMWPSSTSQGIDLNTMITSDLGWELLFATDVNNRGEIVGAGIFNGALHAYVLIPRSEPTPRPRPTPAPRP